ncbi:MAG: hypothetical protein HY551_00405 [Elusimicrobia bacterium]|nr:hypothetical protein [Elusimicrobiota bacterium]
MTLCRWAFPLPPSGEMQIAVFLKDPEPVLVSLKFLSIEGIERLGFVAFESRSGVEPPLGQDVRVDPALPRSELVEERHWAILPPGATLRRWNGRFNLDAGQKEHLKILGEPDAPDVYAGAVWDYPVGTLVAHGMFLKTNPPRLFEFRTVQKQRDGRWAFRVYAPNPSGVGLSRSVRKETFSWRVFLKKRGFVRLDGKRLGSDQNVCLSCHFSHGQKMYAYRGEPEEFAGPCGFGPDNPNLEAWARAYRFRHGTWPFQPK